MAVSASTLDVLPGSRVESFQLRDVAELVVLQRCCWVQEAITNNTLDIPALHETHAEVRQWAATWTTLVVRRHGRLVGAVRGRREGADWQIGRLMVAPDLAGHGIGSALLRTIEDAAPATVDQFVLFTGADSERNVRIYQRAGYRIIPAPETNASDHIAGVVYLAKPRVTRQPAPSPSTL